MPTTPKNKVVITENEGDIVLHPGDDDVFVRTGKQIIQDCQLSIGISVWVQELNEMLAEVKQWCIDRAAKITTCLAVGRGPKVLLFFIPAGKEFNFDLAEELADLNRHLVSDFNIGMVEIGQIPASEVERFLNLDTARIVYGRLTEAS